MSQRLLIIDDNHELAEDLVEIFAAQDYKVTVVSSAREGLETAGHIGFDLAFVDVNLPDTAGHELVPKLKALCPLGEVLLITGHASMDSAIAAVRVGAFQYVVKPFNVEELLATSARAMAQVQLRYEREALSHALGESERRYRDVVESTGVLVIALDRVGAICMANRKAIARIGVPQGELVGADFVQQCLVTDAHTLARSRIAAVLASSAPLEFEGPLKTTDGSRRTVRWHVTPAVGATRDQDGVVLYLTGVDVSERLELERRAAESEALAQMGTLAAGLAHEIRNPLNAAGLQLHMLGRGIDKLMGEEREPLKSRVDVVATELKRLEHLLSDFLDLARPRPIQRSPVDIRQLVAQVLTWHEVTAQSRDVRIEITALPALALGDRERLEQVFHNLVVNALEASPSGSRVRVAIHVDHETRPATVVAEIADEGRGISPEVLSRIYEPFFTTKPAGTGLGLTIVRQIVHRHGGSVLIESVSRKGTRVVVRLPAAETHEEPRPGTA
ncbi:MAG: ATP-binding protein [Deltaproteobacteria bacterium]|nr:ATP-binding protein [Deltaproteobacteria bacterium]